MKGEILISNNEFADIVKGFCLAMLYDNRIDITTIVTRTFTISIYYKFPWYKWYVVQKIKKKVDKFDYRIQEQSIRKCFAWTRKEQNAMPEKELTRFAYPIVQGDPECRNGEAIINRQTNEIIGYKK